MPPVSTARPQPVSFLMTATSRSSLSLLHRRLIYDLAPACTLSDPYPAIPAVVSAVTITYWFQDINQFYQMNAALSGSSGNSVWQLLFSGIGAGCGGSRIYQMCWISGKRRSSADVNFNEMPHGSNPFIMSSLPWLRHGGGIY